MSESAAEDHLGQSIARSAGPPLTPQAIDAVLADFRAWLAQLALTVPNPMPLPAEPVDLHTLVAQFTALRHEMNLQTRAARAQQEQSAEALQRYAEVFQKLETATEEVLEGQEQAQGEGLKPLLKGLIEAADAQRLALREMERVRDGVDGILKDHAALGAQVGDAPRLPFLARLFGAEAVLAQQRHWLNELETRMASVDSADQPLSPATAEAIRGRVEAAVSGLAMGLQRIERVLAQCGLEPIAAQGQPFDPERMEAIEVAHDSDRPSREVVAEVRRGYLWRDRVFRFAQVRVAK